MWFVMLECTRGGSTGGVRGSKRTEDGGWGGEARQAPEIARATERLLGLWVSGVEGGSSYRKGGHQ